MSQPGRPTSSGRSLAPLAFMSLNFTPDFVPCWKLPKLLFCSVLPDVIVTANPAAASAGWSVFATPLQIVLPDGLDCVHVACSTSQTTYLPGFNENEYAPDASVVLNANVVSPLSRTPLPLLSVYARMSQPRWFPSRRSSVVPLAFRSLNFTPDFVPCWKLPKLLFCS